MLPMTKGSEVPCFVLRRSRPVPLSAKQLQT
jgi:hypothetical protein